MSNTSATFVLRSIKSKGTSKLSCQVRGEGLALMVSTPIKVDVIAWRKAHHAGASKSALKNYNASAEGVRVASQIAIAEGQVIAAVDEGVKDGKTIAKRIANALILDDAKKTAAEAEKLQESCVLPFMDDFLAKADSGIAKNPKGKKLDITTKNYYHKLRDMFGAYIHEDNNLTFDKLDEDYRDGFISYCEASHIMRSTIKQYLAKMGAICRKAWNKGLISPDKVGVLDLWNKFVVNTDTDTKEEVALDKAEVEALFFMDMDSYYTTDNEGNKNYKFDDTDKLVRDIAIAGVDVIQRWSDYSVLSSDMIRTDDNNRTYYTFVQKKTGQRVSIPTCGAVVGHLEEIMERNNGTFSKFDIKKKEFVSKVCQTTFANRLKKILRELSASVPTLKESYITPMSCDEIKMEKDFTNLCKRHEEGRLKTGCADYYRWKREMRLQTLNGALGTGHIFKRNAKCGEYECVKEKWQLCNSHTMRRSGATIALNDGLLSHEQVKRIGGWRTEKAFGKYDLRKDNDLDAAIFDKLNPSKEEDKDKANIVNMAVNQ